MLYPQQTLRLKQKETLFLKSTLKYEEGKLARVSSTHLDNSASRWTGVISVKLS